mmetsp:Transcript_3309/g.9803  ORF Transcript_3309/g.9803 Transcript_3309/m.9803 type:complete len:88 (+) Transcript_3309:25-288(+)
MLRTRPQVDSTRDRNTDLTMRSTIVALSAHFKLMQTCEQAVTRTARALAESPRTREVHYLATQHTTLLLFVSHSDDHKPAKCSASCF